MNPAGRITIYSRNIFGIPFFAPPHAPRIEKICGQALSAHADIVLFQEVFLPKDRRAVKRHLSGFQIFQSNHGVLGLGGGLCAAFKNNVTVRNPRFVPFHSSGFIGDQTMTDKIAQKGFQIFDIISPVALTVINTHLTCPYLKSLDNGSAIKNLMARQLDAIATRVKREKNPVIICGDFNLSIMQDIMRHFMDDTGLMDRNAGIGNTLLGNFYAPHWLFPSQIITADRPDHILTKHFPANWTVSAQKADDRGAILSDHAAIVTTIDF